MGIITLTLRETARGNDVNTDIDRLHAVIEGKLTGRGCGKTFALCHSLAGMIETSDLDTVFVVMSLYRDIGYIRPMIEQVLAEHEIEHMWREHFKLAVRYLGKEKTIVFVTERELKDGCTHGRHCDIIYMRHWD